MRAIRADTTALGNGVAEVEMTQADRMKLSAGKTQPPCGARRGERRTFMRGKNSQLRSNPCERPESLAATAGQTDKRTPFLRP